MEDHQSLIAKIKNEPMEQDDLEIVEELIVDGYEVDAEDMNQLEVEPSDLGILGNIMESYDELIAEGSSPGQVEFVLGDLKYSYIVTVKRIDKPLTVDKNNSDTTLSDSPTKKTNHRKTVKRRSDDPQLTPDPVIESISKMEPITDDEIILETDTEFEESQVTDEVDESLGENAESSFDFDDERLSDEEDDEEEEEEFVDELENDDLSFEENDADDDSLFSLSFSEPSDDDDFKPNDKSKSKGKDDNVDKSIKVVDDVNDERSTFKCHKCQFMTARIDRLNEHVKCKHADKLPKEKVTRKRTEAQKEQRRKQIRAKRELDKLFKEPKKDKKKRPIRRSKAVKEFLDFINAETKTNEDETEPATNTNGDHKCSFCAFACDDQTELYRHIGLVHAHNPNEHYRKGKLKTDCALCSFKGINRKSLLLHLRTKHRGGKGYQCHQCSYKTHHKSNFDRHVEVVHDKRKDVKCPECGFLTTRNYLLEKHVLYKHKGIMPYRCSEPGCDFGSTSSSNRKAHIMEVHRGYKPHICTVETCDFSTSRKFILRNHLFKEHGIGQPTASGGIKITAEGDEFKARYLCPHCPHQATQKGNLHKHIQSKHLGVVKRFKCADCDFSSSEKCFVKTHIAEVHLGQYLYQCDLCKFKCSVKQRFERHYSAVHMRQKPYHCQFCDYKAGQTIHLQRHIEVIHRGEKPHFCAYCKFNTAHRANLRAHLKSIHHVTDDQLKEVLLQCVDLRVKKKGNDRLPPDAPVTIIELKPEEVAKQCNNQRTGITISLPTVVTVPPVSHHTIESMDDLEALEASLVLEKIGQHQSLAIANEVEVIDIAGQSQIEKSPKPIQARVIRRQISPTTRQIYIAKPS